MKGSISPGSADRRNERQVTHRELTDAPDPPFCIVPVKVDLRPVAAHNRHSCAGYDARARGGTDAALLVIGRIRLQSGQVLVAG